MRVNPFRISVTTLLLLVLSVPTAFADSQCPSPDKQFDARPYIRRAEAAEQANRLDEARRELKHIEDLCATHVDINAVHAVGSRITHKEGVLAEQRQDYREAGRLYFGLREYADADRVMMKWMHANSTSDKVFPEVYWYFTHERKLGANDAPVQELRALAYKNGDAALAREHQNFSPLNPTLEDLKVARGWYKQVDMEAPKVMQRAIQRGETLAKDDAVGMLEKAMQYYGFAGDKAKQKQVRDRAAILGDAAARKGEYATAQRYYRLAGNGDKAEKLGREVEAGRKKDEAARRKNFDNDQKKLEKELGL